MTATRLVRRTKYSGNLLSKLDEVSLRLLFLIISYSYFDHISYFEPREKNKVRLLTDYVNLTLMKHFHLYQQAWLRIERRTEALGGVDAGRQGSDPPLPPAGTSDGPFLGRMQTQRSRLLAWIYKMRIIIRIMEFAVSDSSCHTVSNVFFSDDCISKAPKIFFAFENRILLIEQRLVDEHAF